MTVASEIARLQAAKGNIKASIEGKGVFVPGASLLSAYAALINNIDISGIDVSDANAVVADVLAGKTFYAGTSEKKTGTLEPIKFASGLVNVVNDGYSPGVRGFKIYPGFFVKYFFAFRTGEISTSYYVTFHLNHNMLFSGSNRVILAKDSSNPTLISNYTNTEEEFAVATTTATSGEHAWFAFG